MKHTLLIRLGGLAAMVSGCLYAGQGLLVPPLLRLLVPKDAVRMEPGLIGGDVSQEGATFGERIIGVTDTVFFVLLILSVMALVVAVHALQAESYGPGTVERIGLGPLTILPSIVGMALFLVGYLRDIGGPPNRILSDFSPAAQYLVLSGTVVATAGLWFLVCMTLVTRVLPWWAGPAMIAGSPPIAFLLGPLLGLPWALVGYAVFRAAAYPSERPPRVR